MTWARKFAVAFAGIGWSFRTHTSFWIHAPVAAVVIAIAGWLQVEPWRWVALVVAITMVLATELLNTSIEQVIQALHPEHDPRIGLALDIAAGGVLMASIGASVIGLITLGPPLWQALVN